MPTTEEKQKIFEELVRRGAFAKDPAKRHVAAELAKRKIIQWNGDVYGDPGNEPTKPTVKAKPARRGNGDPYGDPADTHEKTVTDKRKSLVPSQKKPDAYPKAKLKSGETYGPVDDSAMHNTIGAYKPPKQSFADRALDTAQKIVGLPKGVVNEAQLALKRSSLPGVGGYKPVTTEQKEWMRQHDQQGFLSGLWNAAGQSTAHYGDPGAQRALTQGTQRQFRGPLGHAVPIAGEMLSDPLTALLGGANGLKVPAAVRAGVDFGFAGMQTAPYALHPEKIKEDPNAAFVNLLMAGLAAHGGAKGLLHERGMAALERSQSGGRAATEALRPPKASRPPVRPAARRKGNAAPHPTGSKETLPTDFVARPRGRPEQQALPEPATKASVPKSNAPAVKSGGAFRSGTLRPEEIGVELLMQHDDINETVARLAGEVGNGKISLANAIEHVTEQARARVGGSVKELVDGGRTSADTASDGAEPEGQRGSQPKVQPGEQVGPQNDFSGVSDRQLEQYASGKGIDDERLTAEATAELTRRRQMPATARETVEAFQKQSKSGKAKEALDALETAAKERLKSRRGKLTSGIDPLDLADYALIGAAKIGKGTITFAEWSAQMVQELGDEIKPHLRSVYEHTLTAYENHVRPGLGDNAPKPEVLPTLTPKAEPTPGVTGGKNAVVEGERQARGLPDVERQEKQTVAASYEAGRTSVTAGRIDPRKLAKEIADTPRPLSAQEVGALIYDRTELHKAYNSTAAELDKAIADGDTEATAKLRREFAELDGDLSQNDAALVRGGREQSAAFAARKAMALTDAGDFAGVVTRAKRLKGAELTPKETAQIKKLTDAVKQSDAQYEAATKQARERNAKQSEVAAQRIIEQEARKAGRTQKRVDSKEQRGKLLGDLRKALSSQSLNIGPEQLVQIAPIIKDLVMNLIHDGVTRLADVVDAIKAEAPELTDRDIHDALSGYGLPKEPVTRTEVAKKLAALRKEAKLLSVVEDETGGTDTRPERAPPKRGTPEQETLRRGIRDERTLRDIRADIAEYERQLEESNFASKMKRPKPVVDERVKQARIEREYARQKVEAQIAAMQPKSRLQRAVDYSRTAKIASIPVYAKLLGASVWHFPVAAIEDIMSVPIGYLKVGGQRLKDVAAREGQFSVGAEVTKLRGAFSREAAANARQMLATGTNSLRALAGETPREGGKLGVGNFVGRSHGAEKSFLQTAEYRKSLALRERRAAAQGQDISDPEVSAKLQVGAALDAQSAILQAKNAASSSISSLISNMQRSKAPSTRIAGAVVQSLVPILKTAANYTGKAIQLTGAGLIEGAVRHGAAIRDARAGVEFTPEQADAILRAYKAGGVGGLAFILGWMQPSGFSAGGFYQPGQKGNEKAGTFEIGGVEIPHTVAHSPFLEAVQFWATAKRNYEKAAAENEGDALSLAGDVGTAAFGLTRQSPGVESLSMAVGALAGEKNPGKALGETLAADVLPGVSSNLAQYFDRDEEGHISPRKVRGFRDAFANRTPGLRNTLPAKK